MFRGVNKRKHYSHVIQKKKLKFGSEDELAMKFIVGGGDKLVLAKNSFIHSFNR